MFKLLYSTYTANSAISTADATINSLIYRPIQVLITLKDIMCTKTSRCGKAYLRHPDPSVLPTNYLFSKEPASGYAIISTQFSFRTLSLNSRWASPQRQQSTTRGWHLIHFWPLLQFCTIQRRESLSELSRTYLSGNSIYTFNAYVTMTHLKVIGGAATALHWGTFATQILWLWYGCPLGHWEQAYTKWVDFIQFISQ